MHFKFFDVVRKCNESMGNFQVRDQLKQHFNVEFQHEIDTCEFLDESEILWFVIYVKYKK